MVVLILQNLLLLLYRIMAASKLLQWLLHLYGRQSSRQGKADRIALRPTAQAAMTLVNMIAATSEVEA